MLFVWRKPEVTLSYVYFEMELGENTFSILQLWRFFVHKEESNEVGKVVEEREKGKWN